MNVKEVLYFWFQEVDSANWFKQNEEVDRQIKERFSSVHEQATKGELWHWRDCIQGRVAEIILLDQFSRNLYRNQAEAYAYDGMALVLAQEAIRTGEASTLTTSERSFLYMPFMHAESLAIHEIARELFQEEGMEENLRYEIEHQEIIQQFGRYPHRNQALSRASTPEEIEFLKEHKGF
ncbi:DUF924 family protein [Jeotgalibaca caeni]|uniref:DUF924 family protein n=1 Tax=Jeotgalibaca caeni TaxID=3028623 RepID=UPI00237D692B|nr:DUF924 family protein [Jeotgalibaca caeni]MDE1549683.1 DUF924 domain-containing protein [Jeotgalibaca caeni]